MNFRNKGKSAEKDRVMKHVYTITLQGSIDQMRTRIAIEQGAMHQVRLSVARWRGGDPGGQPEYGQAAVPGAEPVPAMAASQVEWHAAAQCHFLCWLAKGGFSQACTEAEVAKPASAADAAHAAADSKVGARVEAQISAADYHKCNCTA